MSKSFTFNMRLIIILFTLVFPAFCFASASEPLEAVFKLEQNNPDKTFSATLTLKNKSHFTFNHWQLAFNFIRSINHINEGIITQRVGYFYMIAPKTKKMQVLPPESQIVFHLTGSVPIKHVSDVPAGYFLVVTQGKGKSQSIISVKPKSILPTWTPEIGEDEYTKNVRKNQTSIEGNPIKPTISLEQSLIIPLPVSLERSSGVFTLKPNTTILIEKNSESALNAAMFFAKSITPATGFHLKPKLEETAVKSSNVILFTHEGADSKLGKEGYILQVLPNSIVIRATTDAGFFYGIQTLRQLLPPAIFNRKKMHNIAWNIPALTIYDYPRFGYRGLMLDVARHFMPVNQVKRLIDLMALHKLNTFQWHLTDDEGWRIEIKRYPQLTAIGAWRGFNRAIPPALGSGAKTYGGFYKQAEIRDIVRYAKERHIVIVPEIDMPGHARALLKSLPGMLVDSEDKSTYTSIQGNRDNVLSPCLESTFTVIDNIMTEIAALFPSDTVHIGSDEVPQGVWEQSPRCQLLMKKLGLQNKDDLQDYFLKRVQKILQTKNRKMALWDDATKKGDLGHATKVYSWTTEQAGLEAAKLGYSVVLMPASYLYFDQAYSTNTLEPGLHWAGVVDTFKVYSYQPLDASLPHAISKNILGVEGALWSENISTQERLDYLAFPKLLALSEVAWTPKGRRNWINFSERVGRLHLKRLDYYGVNYRISPPGINSAQFLKGILDANIEFPGLVYPKNFKKNLYAK